jgi:hypothetical protein
MTCSGTVVVVEDVDEGDVVGVDEEGVVERSIKNAAPTKTMMIARTTPSDGW